MVRIPKDLVEIEGINEGDSVELNINKMRKDWFGAFKGLKPYNKNIDRAHSKYE